MAIVDSTSRPGVMTRLIIKEISGVDKPACEHCTVAFIKSATGAEDGDRFEPGAMVTRGAELMAAPDADDDPPPTDTEIDWAKTADSHHAIISGLAKTRAKADGTSFEQAYSKLLAEHPRAAER